MYYLISNYKEMSIIYLYSVLWIFYKTRSGVKGKKIYLSEKMIFWTKYMCAVLAINPEVSFLFSFQSKLLSILSCKNKPVKYRQFGILLSNHYVQSAKFWCQSSRQLRVKLWEVPSCRQTLGVPEVIISQWAGQSWHQHWSVWRLLRIWMFMS